MLVMMYVVIEFRNYDTRMMRARENNPHNFVPFGAKFLYFFNRPKAINNYSKNPNVPYSAGN